MHNEGTQFLLVFAAFMLGVFVDRFAFHELIQEDYESEPESPAWLVPESDDVWYHEAAEIEREFDSLPYNWENGNG